MNDVEQFLERVRPIWRRCEDAGQRIVVAVSGGADSVALLHAALRLSDDPRRTLTVAHIHHAARGSEADADQSFVRELAAAHQLNCDGRRLAEQEPGSRPASEARWRKHRYAALLEIARVRAARWIATAHTLDDQVETVLFRLLRGTGIDGLAGIQPIRRMADDVSLIRPLLGVRRHDVEAFLQALQQPFRTDTSNCDRRWARNRIRHEVLPWLRERFPWPIESSLQRLAVIAAEYQQWLQQEAIARLHLTAADAGRTLRIALEPLAGTPPLLVRAVLREAWTRHGWPLQGMGLAQWRRLADWAATEPGDRENSTLCLPGGIRATRDGDYLELRRTGGNEAAG